MYNGSAIDGATSNSLTLTNAAYSQGGVYSVVLADAYETVTNSTTLSVVPVAAWGYPGQGQSSVPPDLTNLIAVACGESHGLALNANGTVTGWGNSLAAAPLGLTNVIAIAAGNDESLALLNDGTVLAWGNNEYGQTNVPAGLTDVVAVAAGEWNCMALQSSGTVIAWGVGTNTGGYPNLGQSIVPANLSNVVHIATGGLNDLGLKNDGSLVAWGDNSYGENNSPLGLTNIDTIAVGRGHCVALRTDGTVVAWGYDFYGETNVPAGLTNVAAVSANGFQTLALVANGPPPLQVPISNLALAPTGFSLSLPTQSGRVYRMEYKNSLSDSNWTASPLAAGNGGTLTFTDSGATNSSQRFYRVRKW